MRLNRLDLNLLVALDALLAERSVTRAAARLKLTPSAMSSALARLREYFGDDLLVQVGRKLEATPRAEALHDAVRDVLVRIESTIAAQPRFDPTTSDRTFRLFLSDYSQMVLAPHLLALACELNCSARFEFLPQVHNPHRNLERAEADLLIIPQSFMSPDHPKEPLYNEEYVCVVSRNGKLAHGELSFERYIAAGHVMMQPPDGIGESFEAWFLKRYGATRQVAVTTYAFSTLPALVCNTDHVATVQGRLARAFAATWPVVVKTPPIAIEPMQQAVQWHRYRTQDPGLVWLRDLLRQAVMRMDGPGLNRPLATS